MITQPSLRDSGWNFSDKHHGASLNFFLTLLFSHLLTLLTLLKYSRNEIMRCWSSSQSLLKMQRRLWAKVIEVATFSNTGFS